MGDMISREVEEVEEEFIFTYNNIYD